MHDKEANINIKEKSNPQNIKAKFGRNAETAVKHTNLKDTKHFGKDVQDVIAEITSRGCAAAPAE